MLQYGDEEFYLDLLNFFERENVSVNNFQQLVTALERENYKEVLTTVERLHSNFQQIFAEKIAACCLGIVNLCKEALSAQISDTTELDGEQRRRIHDAAIEACNQGIRLKLFLQRAFGRESNAGELAEYLWTVSRLRNSRFGTREPTPDPDAAE